MKKSFVQAQRAWTTDEARDLLAPIYGWFTEGFDTKDLQEAKAVLDELATEGNKTAKGAE